MICAKYLPDSSQTLHGNWFVLQCLVLVWNAFFTPTPLSPKLYWSWRWTVVLFDVL